MARKDYVRTNLLGYPYNGKYSPKGDDKGNLYHGYPSDKEETLFYDFAVQGYDLAFICRGKKYYFLTGPDYVARCDENYSEEYERFPDGNSALEQFTIDGKSIIELVDEIEDCEPV